MIQSNNLDEIYTYSLKMKRLLIFFILSFFPFLFMNCSSDNSEIDPLTLLLSYGYIITRPDGGMGLSFDSEQWKTVEEEIDLTEYRDGTTTTTNLKSSSLPSKVDLRDTGFFPNIGNQGRYGTCVAWAVGYNLKTFMENRDLNQTNSSSSSSSQFSPKFLFVSIPDSEKGANCRGTNFYSALNVLQTTGITTLETVPYDDLGDCSYQAQSSWNQEADNYKITSYRRLDTYDPSGNVTIDNEEIKANISNNNPVVIGARLGDRFMQWRGDGVLGDDNYLYSGQHAFHAMIVGGYDDSKGANGAFLVINSWGEYWGNSGTIWVDYNYFKNQFVFASFVAKNNPSNPQDQNNIVPVYDEADLYAFSFGASVNTSNRQVTLSYVIKNTGNTTITPDSNWAIAFMVYNAYNANDYTIIYYDLFSNNYSDNTCDYDSSNGNAYYCNYNTSVSFASGYGITRSSDLIAGATIPETLNGTYYHLIVADLMDNVSEINEDNNILYSSFSTEYENGVPKTTSKNRKDNPKIEEKMYMSYDEIKKIRPNSYTPQELRLVLKKLKKGVINRQGKIKKSNSQKNDSLKPKPPVMLEEK